MSSPADRAVDAYIAAGGEKDAEARARLIDACWAEEGRLVVHGGNTLRGRAQVRAMFDRFILDARVAGVRVLAKDVRGTTFRFRYATDFVDGTSAEGFDAGEIDDSGRISLLFVFSTPL